MPNPQNKLILSAQSFLPTKYGQSALSVYRWQGHEAIVLSKGKIFSGPVLARVHSQCLTGESFLSLKCDCREQLNKAMQIIARQQQGVIIYLHQEGRGIGLANKIKAYHLQDKGLDTVAANRALGFAPDLRDYNFAARILISLGIDKIILLTNNPDKISQLSDAGVTVVARQALEIKPNQTDQRYLKTKKQKMGHYLKLV